jgi:hypothetical protein
MGTRAVGLFRVQPGGRVCDLFFVRIEARPTHRAREGSFGDLDSACVQDRRRDFAYLRPYIHYAIAAFAYHTASLLRALKKTHDYY